MGLDDDIAILAAAPLFGFLDRDALRLLTFAAERRDLADGDLLFARGDPADGGFVVMAGTIRLEPRLAGAEPVRAGRPELVVIGPEVPVQVVAPDSKPGLPRMLPPVGGVVGGVVVPPQVGSADWAGTLTASQAFLVALKSAQVESRFFAEVSVHVRYFR